MNQFDASALRAVAEKAAQAFQTPAISIAVIQDGKVIFSEGIGTRTMGKTETVDSDTSYAIASMSKSTVSTVLAMLHEQALFNWDDKVTKFLPDYDAFASQEITVIDLLKHNCGLNSESAGTLWYGSDYSREEVVRRLRFLRPVTSFRSAYAYQNVCFLVAGLIIEKISGLSWDDFVTKNIFKPLRMARTFPTIAARDAAGIQNIATPHTQIDSSLTIIPYRNHDNVGPAASVHSTANDLANYLTLFLQEGEFGGKVLLKPESAAFVHQLHHAIPPNTDDFLIHPRLKTMFTSYGLGWYIQDYKGHLRVGHSGGVDGMRCRMDFFPDQQCGLVVLTNSEDRRAYSSVLYTAMDQLFGYEQADWVEAWKNAPGSDTARRTPSRIENTTPSLSLESYTGFRRKARSWFCGSRIRLRLPLTSNIGISTHSHCAGATAIFPPGWLLFHYPVPAE